MKYFIITGASRGLGEGLAMELLCEGHHLFCISRSESNKLKHLAAARNCAIDFFSFDLAVSQDIPHLAGRIFEKIDGEKATGVFLVNNAGIIRPVGRVEDCPSEQTELHIRINLMAPMLLTSAFIRHTAGMKKQKRILNISSGAARNPYYGWSHYCTGKAALEMFGRCVSEEQKQEAYPVETMAVAPGIIDTDMQAVIRGSSEREFIHRDKFVALKESGQLVSPALAGKKLARLLLSNSFSDGESVDIRDKY